MRRCCRAHAPRIEADDLSDQSRSNLGAQKAGEKLPTNTGERFFPAAHVMHSTGTVEPRMREKAALELSGQSVKEEFADSASRGGLNFPILCSMRIAVSRNTRADGDAEDRLSAIIVEATKQ